MPNVNVNFKEEELEELQCVKGVLSWHDFIMCLVPIDQKDIPHVYWVRAGEFRVVGDSIFIEREGHVLTRDGKEYEDVSEEEMTYRPKEGKNDIINRSIDSVKEFVSSFELQYDEIGAPSFVTSDLNEAKRVWAMIYYIFEEKRGSAWLKRKIRTQPICPHCFEVAPFGNLYCPKCGRKLLPSREIEAHGTDWDLMGLNLDGKKLFEEYMKTNSPT